MKKEEAELINKVLKAILIRSVNLNDKILIKLAKIGLLTLEDMEDKHDA